MGYNFAFIEYGKFVALICTLIFEQLYSHPPEYIYWGIKSNGKVPYGYFLFASVLVFFRILDNTSYIHYPEAFRRIEDTIKSGAFGFEIRKL